MHGERRQSGAGSTADNESGAGREESRLSPDAAAMWQETIELRIEGYKMTPGSCTPMMGVFILLVTLSRYLI